MRQAAIVILTTADLIEEHHPIRRTRAVVDTVLEDLDSELGAMYSDRGGPACCPRRW